MTRLKPSLYLDLHSTSMVSRQTLRTLLFSPGIYVTLSLALAVTMLLLRNTLGVINSGYATVLFEPFVTPLLGMCILGGLYVALVATLSVTRERESGTLETLFYGPIRFHDYLLGKQVAHLVAYGGMTITFLLVCLVLAWLTHLLLTPLLLAIAGLSLATTAALIGLALWIASLVRTTRGTLLAFVGLIVVVLALQVGEASLVSIVGSQQLLQFVFLRDSLIFLNQIVNWVSPVSYLFQGTDAAVRQSWGEWVMYFLIALLYGLVTLNLAAVQLRRKGVLR
ncbi:MAG TPA: ABC transporter permease subunit [Anaerolineae bacterium]|nr:ABC transporter permease subunit [Anaerolineae bacterium]